MFAYKVLVEMFDVFEIPTLPMLLAPKESVEIREATPKKLSPKIFAVFTAPETVTLEAIRFVALKFLIDAVEVTASPPV